MTPDHAHAGHASGGHRRREHQGRPAAGTSLRTVSRPFEVWRDRDALAAVLREVAAEAGEADAVAITMTAELSDAFRTKREGVAFVLAAAEEALGDRPLSVLTTAGELVPMGEARARPWDVAAANWMATALAVADALPRRAADRRRQHDRRRRPDRRAGASRRPGTTTSSACRRASSSTPACCAPTSRRSRRACRSAAAGARWRRSTSRSAPTSISSSAISRRRRYDCPTPDGRPATVAFARERIARLVCSDADQLDAGEIDAIAAFLHGEQLRQIEDAARRVRASAAARGARRRGRLRRLPGARGRRAARASGRRRSGAVGRDRRGSRPRALAALLAARLC